MGIQDRDWYREKAKRQKQDLYYDPKLYRSDRCPPPPVRTAPPRSGPGGVLVWGLILLLLYLYFSHRLDGRSQEAPPPADVTPLPQRSASPVQAPPTDAAGIPTYVDIPRRENGTYVLAGEINGRAVHFLVDTGASLTSVPGRLAAELGLQSCTPREFHTAAGSRMGCVGVVDELSFGPFRARQVQVAIMPEMEGEALLGMNLLASLRMEHQRDRIRLIEDWPRL